MKDCPECGEQVADDAVHCGHCGAKVDEERSEKKTMFGVGTVDADSLQSAVEEAQNQSEADAESGAASSDESPEETSDDNEEGSGGFRLPTPGEAGAETSDPEDAEGAAVGMSTDEEGEESSVASGLPEPSDVDDGRLSAPESDAESEDLTEDSSAQPPADAEPGDEPMIGETIRMDSPPHVEEAHHDESAAEETEQEDLPETEPTDMSTSESDGVTVAGDTGQEDEITGYEETVEREAASTDPPPEASEPSTPSEPADQAAGSDSDTAETATEPEGDTRPESAPEEEAATDAPVQGAAPDSQQEESPPTDTAETPESSAGPRFDQAEETAPPQEAGDAEQQKEEDRVSTKTLMFIALGLLFFSMLACGGFIGAYMMGYL